MNTRIRYKNTDGTLKSVKSFQHPTNGGRFSVTINSADNTFIIRDEMADRAVSNGSGTNLHRTKIAAKNALMDLGIEFGEETRSERETPTAV